MPAVFVVDRDKDGRLPFSTSFPRKSIHRTTFLALALLIILSTYLFLFPTPFAFPPRRDHSSSRPTLLAGAAIAGADAASPASTPQRGRLGDTGASKLPQITLDHAQELAAVTSFLASHYQNVIPPTVDPSLPIDPDVVLDFDTRGPRAMDELQALVDDVWALYPVVLYDRLYSPATREIKSILSDMNLRPQPAFFDVDQRDDADVLAPLIERLTDSPELPVLLLRGKSVGSLKQIRALYESGELRWMVSEAGAIIDGGVKKRKGKKK